MKTKQQFYFWALLILFTLSKTLAIFAQAKPPSSEHKEMVAAPTFGAAQINSPAQSTEPVLVILAQLPDAPTDKFVQTDQAYWARTFFGVKPSVADYFTMVSYGNVKLAPARENDASNNGASDDGIVGWVVLTKTFDDYKATNEPGVAITREAIIAANIYVDYAQFDIDANGYIETKELHIYVIASAYESTYSRSALPANDPQIGRMSFPFHDPGFGSNLIPVILDGKVIGDAGHQKMSIAGEMLYKYEGTLFDTDSPNKVGLLAHEIGHHYELPEHYLQQNIAGKEQGEAGRWCLMGTGDFGGKDHDELDYPAHICAPHKMQATWLQPNSIQTDQTVLVREVEKNAEALRLWENGQPGNEYFIVENRNIPTAKDYDWRLPGSGLLIWHVDLKREVVALEPADNEGPGMDANEGDPFSAAIRLNFLPAGPPPNSMSNDGDVTGVSVMNISAPGPTMSASVVVKHIATTILTLASPSIIQANGTSTTTITAVLMDAWQDTVESATNLVNFTITSGTASAQLVGPASVNAAKGVATITLRSTTVPGLVVVQASSPGLISSSTTVAVFLNTTKVSGLIATNTTWKLANSPYEVVDDVTIGQGITLTIEPGVTIRFNRERDIYVNGALIANGTPTNKITFTANSAAPFPGYWGGIKFNASNISTLSILNHCQFLYGGEGFASEYAPIALDARANPAIANITFINNERTGIHLAEITYNANLQLNVVGMPYFIITDDLVVGTGYTMTISPGVLIKFGDTRDFYINGALIANGAASQPIIFTAFADDARGGDTNGDGATFPLPGSWGGIRFNNSNIGSSSVLSYCEFHYGGQNFASEASPITVDGRVNPRLTGITMKNNARNGIRLVEMHYTSPVLLDVVGVPYFLFTEDMTIASGVPMTIKPGVIFKFHDTRDLYINGALHAKGTAAQRIIFTSFKDDAHGGDTNGDGDILPAAGNWGGVRFNDSNIDSLSALSYCEFYYGGQSFASEASPLSLDPRVNPAMANLTFKNNTRNGIRLLEGNYNTNLLLDVAGSPYVILFDDLAVGQDIKLTINPGVIIKFDDTRDLFVSGALIANGTAAQPIIFTSIKDDAHGGDTNNDGPSFPRAGAWGGVRLNKSIIDHLSVLKYCRFYYGGQGFASEPAPFSIDPRTRPVLTNLIFANNTGNGIDLLPGNFNANLVLDALGSPYTIRRDDIFVSPGTRLTINPGVLVKLDRERDIYVRGAIVANGTEANPIFFTSLKDDANGGDTNGDGTSLGMPGDWGGIHFADSSDDLLNSLNFCKIMFGGRGFASEAYPLVFDNASPKVQNTTISSSRSHGVICYNAAGPDFGGGARGSIGGNKFLGFAEVTDKFAFYNDGSAVIFAKFNYWGTVDLNTLRRIIYDFSDNSQKGPVIFDSYLSDFDNEAPQMTVLFPNGGETLLRGQVATLRWFARDNVGVTKIDVALSRDGGQVFQPLTSFSTAPEEFKWNVIGPFSSRCVLKVTGRDAAGNERFDISDNFFALADSGTAINYPPSIPLLLRPLAGEEMRGSDLLIWQASVDPNPFDEIRYRLEIDNNADFASPELVEENIDSSRTSSVSENLKVAAFASGSVIAIRLDKLAGFANLRDDVIYYWRLRARDRQNATSAFTAGTARFFMNKTNTPPLAVVTGFSPANNVEARTARPTISWQAADDPDPSDGADILRYLLQMDDDGEFAADVEISAATPAGVTFHIPAQDLRENARYSYRVQASDDENAISPWSAVQSFFVNAIKEPPRTFAIRAPAPRFVAQNDSVIFQWDATVDPDPLDSLRYVVEWSLNQNFSPGNRLSYPPAITRITFIRPSRADSVFWRLSAVDADTLSTYASNSLQQPRVIRWQTTAVNSSGNDLPATFMLAQNYPNPFNRSTERSRRSPETTIAFALPKPEHVQLRIFDVHGREVRQLLSSQMNAGFHTEKWDGRGNNGLAVGSGVYFYRIEAGMFSAVKKMLVVW